MKLAPNAVFWQDDRVLGVDPAGGTVYKCIESRCIDGTFPHAHSKRPYLMFSRARLKASSAESAQSVPGRTWFP